MWRKSLDIFVFKLGVFSLFFYYDFEYRFSVRIRVVQAGGVGEIVGSVWQIFGCVCWFCFFLGFWRAVVRGLFDVIKQQVGWGVRGTRGRGRVRYQIRGVGVVVCVFIQDSVNLQVQILDFSLLGDFFWFLVNIGVGRVLILEFFWKVGEILDFRFFVFFFFMGVVSVIFGDFFGFGVLFYFFQLVVYVFQLSFDFQYGR